MKTSFFTRLTIHLIAPSLFLMALSPRTLLAYPRDGIGVDGSPAARRLASIDVRVRIEGELHCSSTTPQEDSTFSLIDNRTGKIYQLTGQSKAVRELFESGKHNVAVEGTLATETSLNVQAAEAL
jgi:hypothetical protein